MASGYCTVVLSYIFLDLKFGIPSSYFRSGPAWGIDAALSSVVFAALQKPPLLSASCLFVSSYQWP